MSNVVCLQAHRERLEAEAHAKALILFECATILARRSDPALIALIEESFGADFLAKRVVDSLGGVDPSAARLSPSIR